VNKIKVKLVLDAVEKTFAVCGGPYSNFSAVEKFLEETKDFTYRFCLGDLGGFGPHPDKTIDLLRSAGVICLKGNYDHSVGFGEADCGCGYIDPRDRHFAQVSYDYTFKNTSLKNRLWLQSLPDEIELEWKNKKILLCHGSPDSVNEFVWESETDEKKLSQWFQKNSVEMILCTHSGIPWIKRTNAGQIWFNVGVLGRPAHEDNTRVFYGLVSAENNLNAELVAMNYDSTEVIAAMKQEKLPDEFIESLKTGHWTTCSNILPPEEAHIQKRKH
jgi:predicted phosphodiesterase